jgi:hypothetical protein
MKILTMFIVGIISILWGLWSFYGYKTMIKRFSRKPSEADFEIHKKETQKLAKLEIYIGIILIAISVLRFLITVVIKIF